MCRRTIQGTIGSQPAKGQGWLQIHRTIPTIPNHPQPLHYCSHHQTVHKKTMCRRTIQGTIGRQPAKGQGWLQIHRTIPTIPKSNSAQEDNAQTHDSRHDWQLTGKRTRLATNPLHDSPQFPTVPKPFSTITVINCTLPNLISHK